MHGVSWDTVFPLRMSSERIWLMLGTLDGPKPDPGQSQTSQFFQINDTENVCLSCLQLPNPAARSARWEKTAEYIHVGVYVFMIGGIITHRRLSGGALRCLFELAAMGDARAVCLRHAWSFGELGGFQRQL